MKEEMVTIEDTYDKEGYLVKKTANGFPIFIPRDLAPRVQIINLDTEWVIEKKLMTKKEFNNIYPSHLQ